MPLFSACILMCYMPFLLQSSIWKLSHLPEHTNMTVYILTVMGPETCLLHNFIKALKIKHMKMAYRHSFQPLLSLWKC